MKFPKSQRIRWGKNVRQLRGNSSQLKFAQYLGIPQPTLWKIENGEMNLTDDVKWLICGKVGRSVDDVFPAPAIIPQLVADDDRGDDDGKAA